MELDGELSSFERALLEAHLEGCPPCSDFRGEIKGLTGALRVAPLERFEGVVIGRMRRHVRIRLAPAAAAMAVAAVGLGSILASASFRSSPVGRFAAQSVDVTPAASAADTMTMNLATSRARARLNLRPAGRPAAAMNSSVKGGPVVSER